MKLTVKQARLLKEKTQRQMATDLGLHVDTYRKIERNPDAATVGQAKRISEITGIPYNDIF
jgi:DNA-binding XRE family transcriptional regulator